jgi:hypothetical protein
MNESSSSSSSTLSSRLMCCYNDEIENTIELPYNNMQLLIILIKNNIYTYKQDSKY